MIRPPPMPTLFPYTTLFRSSSAGQDREQHLGTGRARGQTGQHSPYGERRVEPARLQRGDSPRHVRGRQRDRKSTRLNSSHPSTSYAVFCLKKKNRPCTTNVA